MKRKPNPYNIWISNNKDGWTTFGEYWNAKRRVFKRIRTVEAIADPARCLSDHYAAYKRPFVFCGDPLPHGWLTALRKAAPGVPMKQG